MNNTRKGILIVISSPSGAGKTTLARRLLSEFPEIGFSVSYTTRSPRAGEKDGHDYFFVSPSVFEKMIDNGDFAEHALVHGNRYGTSKRIVEAAIHKGKDVVFDVDWQGGEKLAGSFPKDTLMIFVLPPDLDTLEARLRKRATDSSEVIERRLAKAIEEIGHHDKYRHLVINDDLERAYKQLRALYLWRRDEAGAPDEIVSLVQESMTEGVLAHAKHLTSS